VGNPHNIAIYSWMEFKHFWNSRRVSVSQWWLSQRISKFLRSEYCRPKNAMLVWGFVLGACMECTAETPQVWATVVILGDPKMCLLYVSFNGDIWFWCCDPQKTAEFLRWHRTVMMWFNLSRYRAAADHKMTIRLGIRRFKRLIV